MNNKTDLGKYDLKHLLRNPMTIHKIQDRLKELDGGELMLSGTSIGLAIVAYRDTALRALINILYNEPDRNKVVELIGKETMDWICEYMGESVDDLRDLNIFTKS